MRLRTSPLLAVACLLVGATSATAGMPAPLPTDFEVRTALRRDESADGSVRFVSDRVSPAVLRALSTPDGGEPADEPGAAPR